MLVFTPTYNTYAITQSFTLTNGGNNAWAMITNGTRINSIVITTPTVSASNTFYYFKDQPVTNSSGFYIAFNSNAVRTVSATLQTQTIYVTNFGQTTPFYSNVVVNMVGSTNVLVTNLTPWRVLTTGVAASNGTVTTLLFDPPVHASFGVTYTNAGIATISAGSSGTIIIDHDPDL